MKLEEPQDGHEDVEPEGVVGLQHVEDGGEGVEGQAGPVDGRGGDGLGEVLADSGEEHGGVVALEDEVDEQVVGAGELFLGDGMQGGRGDDELLEDLVLLLLLDEGRDVVADVEEVGHLLRQLLEGAIDEDELWRVGGRHVDLFLFISVLSFFCFIFLDLGLGPGKLRLMPFCC